VAEQRVPVSLPKRKGASWEAAASARRAPVVTNPSVDAVGAEQFEPLEDLLDTARASAEVRRILSEEAEAARLVLLEEEMPAAVAARLGVPAADVYASTKRAKRVLRLALCTE
jgi:hypothetical protein